MKRDNSYANHLAHGADLVCLQNNKEIILNERCLQSANLMKEIVPANVGAR